MSLDRPAPGTAADWLRHARSALSLARLRVSPEVLIETLCYHTQQAAEKSLKAVLVHAGIPFPRTHNLKILLELLPPACHVPESVAQAAGLTDYAVLSRYPGAYEEIGEEEYLKAVKLAEAVVAWATQLLLPSEDRMGR